MIKVDNDFLLIRNNAVGRYTNLNMFKNGEKVSTMAVIDYNINIGSSSVKAAGIGGVNTEKKFQNQGFMRLLIENAIKFISKNGYSISMLYGIPNLYSKFNYISALPEISITTKTSYFNDYKFETFPLKQREFSFDDCKDIIKLYNRNKYNFNIIRNEKTFFGFSNGSRFGVDTDTKIFIDNDNNLVGYLVIDNLENELNITEIEVVDNKYYDSFLDYILKLANKKDVAQFKIFLPKEHSFITFIKRFGYSITYNYYHFEKGMVRIHNLFQFFMEIKDELFKRLSDRGIKSFNLDIITELTPLNISLMSGDLRITRDLKCENSIKLSSSNLIQFIIGYKSWDEVLVESNNIETIGDATIITYLASQTKPFLWTTDYF